MTTPILDLDEWEQSQAQPHVTVNEALRWLECFAVLIVADKDLTTPPGSPSDGDRYIVGEGATDDWSGHDNEIAMYMGTAWAFKVPPIGTVAYVSDEDADYRFIGGSTGAWELIVDYAGS